jgi:hypothetical protein
MAKQKINKYYCYDKLGFDECPAKTLLITLFMYDLFHTYVIFKCQVVGLSLQVKRERAEREALGALPIYQRTIP